LFIHALFHYVQRALKAGKLTVLMTTNNTTKIATPTQNADQFILEGGVPLRGIVDLKGAKNAVPKCMVAALLSRESSTLYNVPLIDDVSIASEMIAELGGHVEEPEPGTLIVHSPKLHAIEPGRLKEIAGRGRIPILFAGPLLHRTGEALVPELGGCKIGKRPVNFHLNILRQLGAVVTEVPKGYHITAPNGLTGARITLPYPSVGATEQALLAGVLADGITEIRNAAVEPEIIDLVTLLQKMGALITVDVNRAITIEGVTRLSAFEHIVIPDRIEAASWACAAASTDGEIFVRGARQLDMLTFLNTFQKVGGGFSVQNDGITFWRQRQLQSTVLETDVHPGFMTDWQQPFVVLLTQARGASIIHETVYEERFGFTDALVKMGAHIQLYTKCLGNNTRCRFNNHKNWHSAVIVGETPLKGSDIIIPDLRAGFSYVIAALTAKGKSRLSHISMIGRGYERFEEKLANLGANINNA